MKQLIIILSALSGNAFAQIPTDSFHGSVSNNSFHEYCNLNRGEVQFHDEGNGTYSVNWKEIGFATQHGGYPCENQYDAILTPTGKANEWNVKFSYDWNMIGGKAVLKDNILTITASFDYTRHPYNYFQTKMTFDSNKKLMNYQRMIDTWGGPTLFANGSLYQ